MRAMSGQIEQELAALQKWEKEAVKALRGKYDITPQQARLLLVLDEFQYYPQRLVDLAFLLESTVSGITRMGNTLSVKGMVQFAGLYPDYELELTDVGVRMCSQLPPYSLEEYRD